MRQTPVCVCVCVCVCVSTHETNAGCVCVCVCVCLFLCFPAWCLLNLPFAKSPWEPFSLTKYPNLTWPHFFFFFFWKGVFFFFFFSFFPFLGAPPGGFGPSGAPAMACSGPVSGRCSPTKKKKKSKRKEKKK